MVGNGSGETILAAVRVRRRGRRSSSRLPRFRFTGRWRRRFLRGGPVPRTREFASTRRAYLGGRGTGVPSSAAEQPHRRRRRRSSRSGSPGARVLVDQAYVEFAAPRTTARPRRLATEPRRLPHALEGYAAAGFRIGYAVARADLAREVEKGVLPFSVDLAAEELGSLSSRGRRSRKRESRESSLKGRGSRGACGRGTHRRLLVREFPFRPRAGATPAGFAAGFSNGESSSAT